MERRHYSTSPRPATERFNEKVDRSGGPDSCWPWTAGANPDTGYGIFHPVHGKTVLAHRYAYEQAKCELLPGEVVDHECHNDAGCPPGPCSHRLCVNPRHLEAKSNADNVNSSHNSNARKTHCPARHEYRPETTRIHRGGGRSCKICAADRERKRVR